MPNATQLTPGEAVARRTIAAYTLTPEQLRKSEALHRIGLELSLASTLLDFAVLAALIAARFVPRLQGLMQRLPERICPQSAKNGQIGGPSAKKRWVQAVITVPALLLVLSIFQLPLRIYGHRIALAYGLSVQDWGGWLIDRAKSELLVLFFATLVLWGLYALIRRSPRRWWLYAWLCAVPIMAGMVFISPVLIDPLFNRFEPLADTNPELASQLRNLASSAGLEIPPSRIYLMHASEKVTTYNAYVTGFGATKRIVVWDTTARDLTMPQTLFVFAHEMGHYQLHHIYLGLAFAALLTLAGLWFVSRLAPAVLRRLALSWAAGRWRTGSSGARSWGVRWHPSKPTAGSLGTPRWHPSKPTAGSLETTHIPALGDWSSLPLLLLLAGLLSFLGEPLANAFSRWEEHQADLYAVTITRPVFFRAGQDPAQIAAQSFQVLGEKSYSYPKPSPLLVFWSYSHPPIAQRIRFVLGGPARASHWPLPR